MYYQPTTPKIDIKINDIYTIHYFEYRKDYIFEGEKHNFYEILYVDKGEVIASVNENNCILKQSQLVVYSPMEFHLIRANDTVAPNTIIVSFSSDAKCLKHLKNQVFYVNDYMRSLLAGIVKEGKKAYSNNLSDPEYKKLIKHKKSPPLTDGFGAEQVILCYLQLLLIELLRTNKVGVSEPKTMRKKSELDSKFSLITSYIDSHIDEKFTVKNLCAEYLTNKQNLQNVFRSKTGMTVIEYCLKRKIEFAKQYLREDGLNVSEIAEKLGFSSVHYFTRAFKKCENMSPIEYIKSTKSIIDHSKLVIK